MPTVFQRDYLLRLPLPLAQLYSRAHNAKDARGRHDNAFYLCEALVKLAAAPGIACYLQETQAAQPRVEALDRLLVQLALPSLGQWLAMLREVSRHFGARMDAERHPLGHLYQQLTRPRKDLPGLLALYRRIKNGPDGALAADQSCSAMQVLDAMVQYRNQVFGHGGPRFDSFFEKEMGPLLFPAINELFAENVVDWFGPPGTRLAYLTEIRTLDDAHFEVGVRELLGRDSERAAPLRLSAEQTRGLLPNRVALLWPGHPVPLRLDPLLVYRETDQGEDVLFLNRDRNSRQVEYLSYFSGKTEREASMAAALAALLSQVAGKTVTEERLKEFQAQSLAETPSVEVLTGEQPLAGQVLGDYELLGVLGRGGMGVVYLARQLSLGRLVALKTLPADVAGDEVALGRLRREIRALGRCDHPHIVKVLTSGVLPDGQPYYTMEYVPGCDLERVWQELSGAAGSAAGLSGSSWQRAVLSASKKQREQTMKPAADTPTAVPLPLPPLPELPPLNDDPGGYVRRVVLLLRDAARAVQAVHEQNLIHRDVKPANLMLTPDGERLVLMDFGLAKGLTVSRPLSSGGGLLGTLRYAAPEQLAAANLKVGPEADVRGLGVTLWEMLTRRRLFGEAADEMQLAQMVHDSDVPRLRSVELSFDRDLEAIVARATERRVPDRIASARQLADYLQLWLDGRPLPIRTPGAGELLRRWVRTHKPLVGSMVAALLAVLLAASGVGWALWDRAAQETARQTARRVELAGRMAETEKAVTVAVTKAQQSIERAKQLPCTTTVEAKASLAEWREAEAAVAEAEAALTTGAAEDDLRQRVAVIRAQFEEGRRHTELEQARALRKEKLFRDLDNARMTMFSVAGMQVDWSRAAMKYTAAFARFGLEVRPGQTEVLARRISAEEPTVRDALIVALDHWAYCVKPPADAELLAIARAADQNAWRGAYRQAVVARDGAALVRLSKEARLLDLPPTSLVLLVEALSRADQQQETFDLLRWARGLHPTDFWIALHLGIRLLEKGVPADLFSEKRVPADLEECIGCFRVAVALRPDPSITHVSLGMTLIFKNQLDEAVAECKAAVAADPEDPLAHLGLGMLMIMTNQLDDAIAQFKRVIALDPKDVMGHKCLDVALKAKKELDDAIAHVNLGNALYDKNQLNGAIAEFTKAIAVYPKCAPAYDRLGLALVAKKQLDDGIAEFNKAIAIDPKYTQAHHNLGLALMAKKQLDDAIAEFKRAIALDPNNALAHHNLGLALYANDDRLSALLNAYSDTLEMFASSGSNFEYALQCAHGEFSLGIAQKDKQQLDDAINEYYKAIALNPKNALFHLSLGIGLASKKEWDDAIAEFKKAIALDPRNAHAHGALGQTLLRKGRFAEAKTCLQEALDLLPEKEPQRSTILRQRDLNAALLTWESKLPDILTGKARPKDGEWLGFIAVCIFQQRNADAVKLYGDAFTADAKLADDLSAAHRYKAACCAALAAAGQGKYADTLSDKERADLRKQALQWLRADLAAWDKQLDTDAEADKKPTVVRSKISGWKADASLTGVRDPKALEKLPQDERDAWRKQWQDVETLLAKADKKAIVADQKEAVAHVNAGNDLYAKNLDAAIAEYKKAIALDPKYALAHNNLGLALNAKNQVDDAIAEFKNVIKLDPKYAPAHNSLGNALYAKNQMDDAITEYKKAIDLDPKDAAAHVNLGNALYVKNQLDDAIGEYNKAIALNSKYALAHYNLGNALYAKKQFTEAKTSVQKALDLLPEKDPLRPNALRQREQCDIWLALEAKLPEVLAGKAQAKDKGEWADLIAVCGYQQRHAAAAKLYADAFTADAKVADDLNAAHRYNAASYAARAAANQGKDADKLTDKERTDLRKQALQWLRADLAAWGKQLEDEKVRAVVQLKMIRWQKDTDLASVRDPKALEKLPSDERDAWQNLWDDVANLLKKTEKGQ